MKFHDFEDLSTKDNAHITLLEKHVDPRKSFIIKIDASDFTLKSILSHRREYKKLHLIAFDSRKFTIA